MPISFRNCDLDNAFLTEADLMNRFVGQELWVWGAGATGKLGNNSTASTTFSSPIQTISATTNWICVSSNDFSTHTAGLKSDGTLWTWGVGTGGVLGNTSVVTRSSPVQTTGSATNWRFASAGSAATGGLKTDGTLWMWGAGTNGVLGTNSTASSSFPVQVFGNATNWKSLRVSNGFALALKTDGTLWGWGSNTLGRLGDFSTINKSTPVQTVTGGTNWKDAKAGDSSAALKTDGTLWLWGSGADGRLGNGATINASSPVQTVSISTTWKVTSASSNSPTAIKVDGTLWVWGSGVNGRLGNLSTTSVCSPVQTISGGTTWRAVSAGRNSMGAIKVDGTLWMWGQGCMLGDNTSIPKSSPIQTISGGVNWRSIDVGLSSVGGTRLTGE